MKVYEVNFDGGLDLSKGDLLDDFTFPWRDGPCPMTRFRGVWNAQVFAFQFSVEDEDLVLADHEDPGQGALGSDRVELFFASSADLKTPYYGAEMDPGGRVYDYSATHYREIDPAWNFSTLVFSGRVLAGGYQVSGQIKLEELRDLKVLADNEMIAGAYRAEFSHGEGDEIREDWISWIDPGTEKPDFHVPSSFGKFHLVNRS